MNQQTPRQKQHTPWQWYRSRTRKIKLSLICGAFTAVLLFGLCVNVAMGRGSPSSTRHSYATLAVHTATPSPTAIPALELTPMPEQKSSPTHTTKPTTSTTTNQPTALPASSTVYYGVHVAYVDMSLVNAFETDAHKPVAIVMWYQQWGLTDGYQYFQPSWMDAVRAHGSIPLVTWDPWDPTQSPTSQPAYTLQNIINGNFDSYIITCAQASKTWGHPYFLRFAPEMSGNWNPWESFSALFQQTYNDLLAITAKPMMIGEMASTEQAGNKASWISDAYTTQIPQYFPRIKAVVWFNIDKETDWRIESSPAAQNAFAAAIQPGMYASNTYAYLHVSPIPIP